MKWPEWTERGRAEGPGRPLNPSRSGGPGPPGLGLGGVAGPRAGAPVWTLCSLPLYHDLTHLWLVHLSAQQMFTELDRGVLGVMCASKLPSQALAILLWGRQMLNKHSGK